MRDQCYCSPHMNPTPIDSSLAGKRIAVFELRELDIFCSLLERRGAEVVRCPLVTIRDTPDTAGVIAFASRLAAGEVDDLVLFTGEGLKRILGIVERQDAELYRRFVTALGGVRTITRGPKPARALRAIGLRPGIEAGVPTTQGVLEVLSKLELAGRRVVVQLYGDLPNTSIMKLLADRGAVASTVAPYVYADATDTETVRALLKRMSAGEIDAVAFTSRMQVERLCSIEPTSLVRHALERTAIAAVGPLVAEALTARGLTVATSPEHSWFMKPLVAALGEKIGTRRD